MASFKDLAPAEKAKVARLLSQVVEGERAVSQMQAELDDIREHSTNQLAPLREQNHDMAMENSR